MTLKSILWIFLTKINLSSQQQWERIREEKKIYKPKHVSLSKICTSLEYSKFKYLNVSRLTQHSYFVNSFKERSKKGKIKYETRINSHSNHVRCVIYHHNAICFQECFYFRLSSLALINSSTWLKQVNLLTLFSAHKSSVFVCIKIPWMSNKACLAHLLPHSSC